MTDLPSVCSSLSGRKVTILGLGTFGGGLGAVKYLVSQGAEVTIVDQAPPEKLASALSELKDLPIADYFLGTDQSPDCSDAELIIVNPAVRPGHPVWKIASQLQIPITTEIGLFWHMTPSRLIGVTGSNGKSTTAALIAAMIKEETGRCWLGGNLGGSLLSKLDLMTASDWCVLELSSFQLFSLKHLKIQPEVSVITNFSPNHLDWHPDLDHYRQSKQTLIHHQSADQFAVLNRDDSEVFQWDTDATKLYFDSCCSEFQSERLRGPHHQQNINAAVTAVKAIGISDQAIQQALEDFHPLPHRLEYLGEIAGRKFYNDSLATTPESAIAALNSFDEPITLLAGGADKQIDLTPFAQAIAQQTKATILMGDTSHPLAALLENQPETPEVFIARDFSHAFQTAWKSSAPGEVVLLSPGCASYGWFSNFKERGDSFRIQFEQLQLELASKTN